MIMSKRTYSTAANAEKALGKYVPFERRVGVHQLPSGRWCYTFNDAMYVERRNPFTGEQA